MATDLWALGCLLVQHKILADETPYKRSTSRHEVFSAILRKEPPSTNCPTTINQPLWDFIQKCWIIVPEDRPPASELCLLLARRNLRDHHTVPQQSAPTQMCPSISQIAEPVSSPTTRHTDQSSRPHTDLSMPDNTVPHVQRGLELPPHVRLSSFAAPRRPLSPFHHQSGVLTNAVNCLYVVQKEHTSIRETGHYLDVIGDTDGKAYIGMESSHNGVYAEVCERGIQKLRLRVHACHDARIRISRDFAGPVKVNHRHGYAPTSYSPGIHFTFRLLGSAEKKNIGWTGSGYKQRTRRGWDGDELIVRSKLGHIYLFYGDE
ncbi:hypothetical protein FRC03_007099 [Tulasnella sp. 419]|nr:hypothetical protein FRC03_007099 [Tulasnella sp. 419]